MCGEGCLMTLEGCATPGSRPSPTNASKRQPPLRPTSARLLPLCAKFAVLEPPLSVSVVADSMGRSRCEETVRYRVAGWGSVGRVVVADGCWRASRLRRHSTRRLAMLPVLQRIGAALLLFTTAA